MVLLNVAGLFPISVRHNDDAPNGNNINRPNMDLANIVFLTEQLF